MGQFRIVKEGEGLSSIAFETGFAPQTIWQHDQNEALREQRKDMNILLPGDSVWIPDLQAKSEACSLDKRHVFRMPSVPAKFRLQIFYHEQLVTGAPYRLVVDGQTKTGVTDGSGITEEFLMPNSKEGLLSVRLPEPAPPLLYKIAFGYLDPTQAATGVEQRLRNLNYFRPSFTQSSGRALWDAIRRFQRDNGLPVTGTPDEATVAKLEQVHDTTQAMQQTASK